MIKYAVCMLVGVVFGIVSVFFAFGGITGRKLFIRLLHRKGRWQRVWLFMIGFSAACGSYGGFLFQGPNRDFFAFSLLNCYLLALSVTDIRGYYLPDDASLCFALIFLVFQITSGSLLRIINSLAGAALGAILLGIPHLLRRKDVNLGDVKLLSVCGLILGFPGVFHTLARCLVFMLLFSLTQLFRKKLEMKSSVPMAPFLFLSVLI